MRSFVLLCLLFTCLPLPAQEGTPAGASAVFPAGRLEELREEVVYTYPDEEEEETIDPLEPIDNPFADWSMSSLRQPVVWVTGLLILLGLGFLIYRILGDLEIKKRARLDGASAARVDVREIVEEEMIEHGVALSLLERAEQAGQYDIAVRLLYISLLKELQDAKMIRYRKDYSNRDYRRQLEGNTLREPFTTVTRAYERFWYGKYRIDRLSYRTTRQEFTALTDRIAALRPKSPADV